MDRALVKSFPAGGAVGYLELWTLFLADLIVTITIHLVAAFCNVLLPFLYGRWHTDGKSLTGNCCLIPTA